MPVALDRYFQPESEAVELVGYKVGYGTVVKFKGGDEYVLPLSGYGDYAALRAAASVGAYVAHFRVTRKLPFLKVEEGSHFPLQDKWAWVVDGLKPGRHQPSGGVV